MKRLITGILAAAMCLCNITMVSAEETFTEVNKQPSAFDGVNIITEKTYQPVSSNPKEMKNAAMGDGLPKAPVYRSALTATSNEPYWNGKNFYNGYGSLMYGGNSKKIIDVWEGNGNIDWDKVKASDIDGVILRVGYGNGEMDKQFLRNLKECNRLQIPYGLYLFSYAYDANFAYAEASGLAGMLKGLDLSNLTYPIYYDIENFGTWKDDDGSIRQTPASVKEYEEIIATFITRMNALGYKENVHVYSGRYYTQTKLNSSKILPYVSWIAEYGPRLNYANTLYSGTSGWQYSDKGKIDGITGDVDLSCFSGSFPVKQPTSVSLSMTALSIEAGLTKKVTAKVSPADAWNTTVTWSSDDTTVAKVSSNGTITAVAAGSAKITATTINNKKASLTVTVTVKKPTIKISAASKMMYRGQTTKLTATSSNGKAVVWKSSEPTIASVDNSGNIKTLKNGTAKITASVNGGSAVCIITVKEPITVSATTTSIYRGKTTTLKATTAYSTAVTWTSDNTSVATVNANGVVTGKKAGTAVITATAYGNKKASKTIKVVEPSIKLNFTKASIYRGKTISLKASTSYSTKVTWTSDKTSVATVSATGVVTGKKAGTVNIYANAYGKKVKCAITVKEPSLKLNKSSTSIYKSKTTTLKASLSYSTKVTWKSSSTKVATVNSKGVVTGKKAGTAYIYATAYGKTVKCKITVKNPTVKLNKTKATAYKGKSYTLKATTSYSTKVTWKSSKTSIATVNSKGVITPKKAGKVTITATAFGKKVSCVITVKNPTLKVSKTSITISKNKSYTVKATAVPGGKVSWSSGNKKIATVSSNGKITGKKKGTTYIYAKINGLKKTIKVRVK